MIVNLEAFSVLKYSEVYYGWLDIRPIQNLRFPRLEVQAHCVRPPSSALRLSLTVGECPPIRPSDHPSICLSILPSICPSFHLSVCLSITFLSITFLPLHSVHYIPSVTFRLLHSVRYILSLTFRLLHSVRYIPSVTFRPLHSVPYIPSVTFHPLHLSLIHI